MKNKDFDSIDKLAQEALSNFEVEFDSMDWLQMQSKLREEKSIDQVAKDALEDYEVPFDAKDWARLEQQLDKKDQLTPYMWWLKGAEVGIMALLVFTVFRFTTEQQHPEQNSTYGNTTTLIQQTISSEQQNSSKEKETVAPLTPSSNAKDANGDHATSDTETEAVITKPQALLEKTELEAAKKATTYDYTASTTAPTVTTVQHDSKEDNQPTVVETKTMSNLSEATKITANTDNEVPNQTTSGFSGKDGTVLTTATATSDNDNNVLANSLSTLETRTENIAADNNMEDAVDNSSQKFSVLNLSPIEASQIEHTDPVFELKRVRLKLPYKGRTHIGGVAIIGANFASSFGGTSVGYGAGITVDHEFTKNIALKSALLVNLKQYELRQSNTNKIPDGSSYTIDRQLKTNLVVIEIPLDIQYTFFQNEKWKIYAVAGLSTNIISSRTYSGLEEYSGTQTYSTPGMSLNRTINSDDYEQGLFSGGQFTRNAFLSIGGGVGLQRQLGEKVSLYILPIYRHAITPVGEDFLSSFGVTIGVKSAF